MPTVAELDRLFRIEAQVSRRALELAAQYGGVPQTYQQLIDDGKVK